MDEFVAKKKMNSLSAKAEMLGQGIKIMGEEIIQSFGPKGLLHSEDYAQEFAPNLIFKLGLNITGAKLLKEFNFCNEHCKETQIETLKHIIKENSHTTFGKDHKFDSIKSVEDFRKNVPVQTYDSLANYIDQHTHGKEDVLVNGRPISYATTSGTTGKPKFIPITKEAQQYSHKNISRIWAYSLYQEVPEAFDGKILAIVSPAVEGNTEDGTTFGSTSGQLLQGMNPVIKQKYVLPYEVLTLEDYTAKYYCILLLGMCSKVTFLSSANPSTLGLLAKKGNEFKEDLLKDIKYGTLNKKIVMPKSIRRIVENQMSPNPALAKKLTKLMEEDKEKKLRPIHYWPELKSIACWTGGNSESFIKMMSEWYGDKNIRDLGYLASEIRGSVPLKSTTNDGVLTISENFFEFVETDQIELKDPDFLMAHELEVGKRYYIFFTTKAGLYRYNINDIIEVKDMERNTPTIIFLQKGKGVTNITGEKLYEQQVMEAMKKSEDELNMSVNFYMYLACMEEAKYQVYTEFSDQTLSNEDHILFAQTLERNLQTISIEYAAKRKSLRLPPIELKVLQEDSFETFKNWRVSQGIREAQFKVVPLTSDVLLTGPLTVQSTVIIDS
jgi:hypothetical protein